MITAVVLWLVLQVPLAILVGKLLKANSDPLDDPPVATPITAAPAAAELFARGVYVDAVS